MRDLEKLVYTIQHSHEDQSLVFNSLALCGEAGELANIVKKLIYYTHTDNPLSANDIVDELCDVLFHVVAICKDLHIPVESLVESTIQKHTGRMQQ